MQKNPKEPMESKIMIAFSMFLLALLVVGIIIRSNNQTGSQISKTIHNSIAGVTCNCEEKINEIENGIIEIKQVLVDSGTAECDTTMEVTDIVKEETVNSEMNASQEYELPDIPTNKKLFTDYRAYNLWYTPHYRLQQVAWTDKLGLRRFNEDYIVALGSYYSTDIGDRFEVVLDTGNIFTIILGDGKADSDCDERCMYTPCIDYEGNKAGNLLEFIVDEKILAKEAYEYGSLDFFDEFKGNVIKITYLGRDDSADWDIYETE